MELLRKLSLPGVAGAPRAAGHETTHRLRG
jgi:hypothetical protein